MSSCSIFKNFHKPIDTKSLIVIAKDIASGKYKTEIEKIRSLLQQGKTEEAQELKKQLPAFTPSAVFNSRRVKNDVKTYSGFVHLDFDKLTDEQLYDLQIITSANPHTHIAFISPSGYGLKLCVEVTSGIEDHDMAYLQVQDYYENLTGLKADPSCKDITRLCFMSYDPNLYKNVGNEKFVVTGTSAASDCQPSGFEEIFLEQIQFTNRIKTYQPGSRNDYLFTLASNCNKAGLPEHTTLDLISGSFDLPLKEIQQTVKSAYRRSLGSLVSLKGLDNRTKPSQPSQHLNPSTPQHLNPSTSQPDDDESNPTAPMATLPDDIFDALPGFLNRATCVANTKEERDILLLGSLTTLSVALHQLSGKYNDTTVNPNLYLFISAGASAGKGILNHCRKLVLPIHQRLREQTKNLRKLYEAELLEYKMNKGKDALLEQPQKPPQKMLFIPANNSAAGFLRLLNDSHKRGIIFETEGDVLTTTLKTEYGDFSAGFRNAFQHEPISYYRKTDEEYVEIDRPCLSVLLSGTPKQIQGLIPNAENGLFSRFMFYVMNMKYEWKNVFASRTGRGLDVYFEDLGKEFSEFYHRLELLPEMTFTLSLEQKERFNSYFSGIQNLYMTIQQEDIISSVRRLGLTAYRIMMIFSALRLMDSGDATRMIVCDDIDFENTLKMITVLVKHSSKVFTQVAEEVKKPKPANRRELFLEQLPEVFNRRGYVEVAIKLNIPDNTAQRYIRKFVAAGVLLNPSHDHYTKVQVEILKKDKVTR